MRLLLDTHVALWAITDSRRLGQAAKTLIGDPANRVSVSAVTIWEIAIKHALCRRGAMPLPAAAALGYFRASGYTLLAIQPAHALALEHLADLHADPFDRMLIAQALTEPLRLVTHDPLVARYSETIIRV
ncbi:MAG: type II toxin-antitoxin system VapC family toxin [Alphaproteobacteria bacterium]|nr:type II toxin-antitoxin system VapC family toxin [Alphaproteobacteria bacterium]